MSSDNIPRRCFVDKMTAAELAIRNAKLAVEEAGCDPRLTDAVVLLSAAQDKVADFVDGKNSPTVSGSFIGSGLSAGWSPGVWLGAQLLNQAQDRHFPAPPNFQELRDEAIKWANENTWKGTFWLGGVSPSTASYWLIDTRPDLSYWPFMERQAEPDPRQLTLKVVQEEESASTAELVNRSDF